MQEEKIAETTQPAETTISVEEEIINSLTEGEGVGPIKAVLTPEKAVTTNDRQENSENSQADNTQTNDTQVNNPQTNDTQTDDTQTDDTQVNNPQTNDPQTNDTQVNNHQVDETKAPEQMVPAPEETNAPTEVHQSESCGCEYEAYLAMSPADQEAYMNSFASPMDFISWSRNAEAEHATHNTVTNVTGGDLDIGDFID